MKYGNELVTKSHSLPPALRCGLPPYALLKEILGSFSDASSSLSEPTATIVGRNQAVDDAFCDVLLRAAAQTDRVFARHFARVRSARQALTALVDATQSGLPDAQDQVRIAVRTVRADAESLAHMGWLSSTALDKIAKKRDKLVPPGVYCSRFPGKGGVRAAVATLLANGAAADFVFDSASLHELEAISTALDHMSSELERGFGAHKYSPQQDPAGQLFLAVATEQPERVAAAVRRIVEGSTNGADAPLCHAASTIVWETTALHRAATRDPLSAVLPMLLQAMGAESREALAVALGARDLRYRTPLHAAAAAGHSDAAVELAQFGAPVDAGDMSGETPLHVAAASSLPDLVHTLISLGAAPTQGDVLGVTPIHLAAAANDVAVLRALLPATGGRAAVVCRDHDGQTPLHYAVRNRAVDTLTVLLTYFRDEPASLISLFDSLGRTVLHELALHVDPVDTAMVTALLDIFARAPAMRGEFLAAVDSDGRSAIWLASAMGGAATVKVMLESCSADDRAAILAARDFLGRTPLHAAALGHASKARRALLAAGASEDVLDVFSATPAEAARMHEEAGTIWIPLLGDGASSAAMPGGTLAVPYAGSGGSSVSSGGSTSSMRIETESAAALFQAEREVVKEVTERILLRLSGPAQRGVSAALLRAVASVRPVVRFGGLSSLHIHGQFCMMILCEVTGSSSTLCKEVAYMARDWNLEMGVDKIDESSAVAQRMDVDSFHMRDGSPSAVDDDLLSMTLMGTDGVLSVHALVTVSREAAARNLSFQKISNLSADFGECSVVSLWVDASQSGETAEAREVAIESFLLSVREQLQEQSIDVAVQRAGAAKRRKRMVVFDMTGTLVKSNAYAILARAHGCEAEMQRLYEQHEAGAIEGIAFLRARCELLRGLTDDVIEAELLPRVRLSRGVRFLCGALHVLGFKTAILSCGLDFLAERVGAALGMDHVICNAAVWTADGSFSGEVQEPAVTVDRKADLLYFLCQKEGILPENCVMVEKAGDGYNPDLVELAGLGVTLHADLKQQASAVSINKNMASLLYLLGHSPAAFVQAEDGSVTLREADSADTSPASSTVDGDVRVPSKNKVYHSAHLQTDDTDDNDRGVDAFREDRSAQTGDLLIATPVERRFTPVPSQRGSAFGSGRGGFHGARRLTSSNWGALPRSEAAATSTPVSSPGTRNGVDLSPMERSMMSGAGTGTPSSTSGVNRLGAAAAIRSTVPASPTKASLSAAASKEGTSTASSLRTVGPEFATDRTRALVAISGPDSPGVMHAMTKLCATAPDVRICDVSQAVISGQLMLVLLVEEPESSQYQAVKEMLFASRELNGIHVTFEKMNRDRVGATAMPASMQHYAMTVVRRQMDFAALSVLAEAVEGEFRQGIITNVSLLSKARGPTDMTGFDCVEILAHVDPRQTPTSLKAELLELGLQLNADVALQSEGAGRRAKRLVVFDMDSTLIQGECINELAALAGVEEKVKAITFRAMNGEIDFEESLRERVGSLAGQPASIIQDVVRDIKMTPGARTLCHVLKEVGFKLAVISGGFTDMVRHVKRELNLDYCFANTLEVKRGLLTGRLLGPIVDGVKKADLCAVIAKQEGISMSQVVAIGDGANDLPMMAASGLGIAFNAKPRVQEEAGFRINHMSLRPLLYFLGLSDSVVRQLGIREDWE